MRPSRAATEIGYAESSGTSVYRAAISASRDGLWNSRNASPSVVSKARFEYFAPTQAAARNATNCATSRLEAGSGSESGKAEPTATPNPGGTTTRLLLDGSSGLNDWTIRVRARRGPDRAGTAKLRPEGQLPRGDPTRDCRRDCRTVGLERVVGRASTTTRCGPEGGIPNRSRVPWTTSVGTRTPSSSASRLAPLGAISGNARHTPRARRSLRRCGTRRAPPRSGRRRGAAARRGGRPPVAPRRRSTPRRAEAPATESGARRRDRVARPARLSRRRRERFGVSTTRSGAATPPPAPWPSTSAKRAGMASAGEPAPGRTECQPGT